MTKRLSIFVSKATKCKPSIIAVKCLQSQPGAGPPSYWNCSCRQPSGARNLAGSKDFDDRH
jgi:hypothetical protein